MKATFALEHQGVKLVDVNPRAELHGDDHVMAADLKMQATMSNDILAEFHPRLRAALYFKSEGSPDLIDIARAGDPAHVPNLVFPKLGPLKWQHEIAGARVTIYAPVSRNDIVLEGCGVDGFTIEAKEGGTIILTFRVKAKPDEDEMGRLCAMIQTDIDLSLEPPQATDEKEAA
jgi:hypothetical protein